MLDGEQDITLPFPQFCRVIVEMRAALEDAAAYRQAIEAAAGGEGESVGGGESGGETGGFLALKGPTQMSSESFKNPLLRHVGSRSSVSRDLRDNCPTPAWLGDGDGEALRTMRQASARLGNGIRRGVMETIVDPLVELGEGVAPLLPLSSETRKLIPEWQEERIAEAVLGLRRHGFPSREVDILINSLYTCCQGGDEGEEAARRAWRVLRANASRFQHEWEEEETLDSVKRRSGRKSVVKEVEKKKKKRSSRMLWRRREEEEERQEEDDPDGGRALPIEETFRYDHHALESEACKRMMKLLSRPLMRTQQLDAIFSAFDLNSDGVIAFDELEKLFRMLDPHKRLARLKPIEVPRLPTALEKAAMEAYEKARPGLERLEHLWYTVNPLAKSIEDDDDDDDDDL